MVQLPSPLRVFISGGTSGIGRALAERFAAHSGTEHVYVAGRRQAELDSLASAHSNVTGLKLDVADLESLPAFVKDLVGKGINFFVINAGMQRGFDFSEPGSVDLKTLDQEMLVNYTSPVHFFGALLRELPADRQVTVCFTTSGLALAPMPRAPNYCASKHALRAFTLSVRRQMQEAKRPVEIVEILPPAVQTELHDDKHQPEFKGKGGSLGVPLKEYTDDLFARLLEGKEDEIAYEMAAMALDKVGKPQRAICEKMPVKI